MMLSKGLLIARGRGENIALNGGAPTLVPFGPLGCLPVANRPLLEHAFDSLLAMGVSELAVAVEADAVPRTGPVVERLEADADGVVVATCELPERAGLRDAVAAAAHVLGEDPFVLHLGESLCWDVDGGFATTDLAADEVISLIGDDNGAAEPLEPHRGERPDGGASLGARSRFGHLGIYAVGARFAAAVAAGKHGRGHAADARAAINRIAKDGGRVHHWRKPSSWHYAPGAASLLQANRLVLERLTPTLVAALVRDCDIDGPVSIHPTAIVESSTLRGPLVIGPNASVSDGYIGPFTSIDHDVVIEGAELENSIVLGGASVCHIGSRLEGSIIGPEAKVCREFRIPRALRLDVGAGAQVSLT